MNGSPAGRRTPAAPTRTARTAAPTTAPTQGPTGTGRAVVAVVASALTAVAVLSACTAAGADRPGPSSAAQAPAPPPPPPPPPAACLLDTAALAAGTGLRWTPDPTTASDTRCVYDPDGAAATDFVAVDVDPAVAPGTAAELDRVAQLCETGSRTPAGDAGFVCRFGGGSVFAAAVRDRQVITVAASAVPPGTTAAQLAAALAGQLTTIG